jgi:hypothetical protein
MFGFLDMIGNYEQRKVANTKVGGANIDTAAVSDSTHPYETGIFHPQYNKGKCIVVELYDTKELSKVGHAKWVKLFSGKKLPDHLTDVSEHDLKMMFGGPERKSYEKKRVKNKSIKK